VPNLILAQRKEDALPIWRPRRIIAVVTRDILENRGLAAGDFRNGNVADLSRVVRFFHGVKCDLRAVGRNCGENSIGNLFGACGIEVCNPNRVVALESDVTIARECRGRKAGQSETKKNYFFHGNASVTKVAASTCKDD
jgi:hypothetical protein